MGKALVQLGLLTGGAADVGCSLSETLSLFFAWAYGSNTVAMEHPCQEERKVEVEKGGERLQEKMV